MPELPPQVRLADTREIAVELASAILGERSRPLVLASTNPSTGQFGIDLADLIDEVGDVCDVWAIITGEASYGLSDLLPAGAEAYGGAARSYPIDFGAQPELHRSPLRFPGRRAQANLVGDVLAHASSAGLFKKSSPRIVPVKGRVDGIFPGGSRALVDVDGHGNATLWHELTFPEYPLDWVVATGQRVEGTLDLDSRRLTVTPLPVDDSTVAAAFPHGSVTLALVSEVTADSATFLLHPAVSISVAQPDVSPNPLDTLDLLLIEGDVVEVRVIHLQGERLHLRLTDLDDDETPLPALPLLAGGQPWLVAGRVLVDDRAAHFDEDEGALSADSPAVAAPETFVVVASQEPVSDTPRPRPGPGLKRAVGTATPAAASTAPVGTSPVTPPSAAAPALQGALLELAAARTRIQELEALLADAGADDGQLRRLTEIARGSQAAMRATRLELGESLRENASLREDLLRSKRALREARNSQPEQGPSSNRDERRARWSSDDGWFRYEVEQSWIERVAPSEREQRPLTPFELGPDFAQSLEALEDGQLERAVRTVMEVVSGIAKRSNSRHVHPLRTDESGGAPQLVRQDGARCFRAAIENGTPAARRLHYWHRTDGVIELSRVVTHDVMVP